jgi:hypothetical protein
MQSILCDVDDACLDELPKPFFSGFWNGTLGELRKKFPKFTRW